MGLWKETLLIVGLMLSLYISSSTLLSLETGKQASLLLLTWTSLAQFRRLPLECSA